MAGWINSPMECNTRSLIFVAQKMLKQLYHATSWCMFKVPVEFLFGTNYDVIEEEDMAQFPTLSNSFHNHTVLY